MPCLKLGCLLTNNAGFEVADITRDTIDCEECLLHARPRNPSLGFFFGSCDGGNRFESAEVGVGVRQAVAVELPQI